MSAKDIRVLATLLGDVRHEPDARTKYGLLLDALARHFTLVEVYDASLAGKDRLMNALRAFSPNKQVWREKFYKNNLAFELRSRRFAEHIRPRLAEFDLIFQVGVLFDANWERRDIPVVPYTDFTARLSANSPWTGRSPFTPTQLAQWLDREREAFVTAAHICTRSHFVRQSVIQDYQIDQQLVTAVGGGVNFSSLPEPAKASKPGESPVALFIGKEFYRKGGDLLLKAFAIVRKELPQARLIMLTKEDIPSGFSLEGVELFPPTWDREVVASLYRRADFLVLPSRLETWGDVLLEAMSYGLPCIGVAGQAMEEIIDDQRAGIIVPPEDEQALAKAMARLYREPDLRRQWGACGRERVESRFTWDRVAQNLEIPFRHAIEDRNLKGGKMGVPR